MDQNAFMPKENEELKFFYFLKNLLISQTFWKVYLHLFRSQFIANKEEVPLHGAW